jgi:hypothetical protein
MLIDSVTGCGAGLAVGGTVGDGVDGADVGWAGCVVVAGLAVAVAVALGWTAAATGLGDAEALLMGVGVATAAGVAVRKVVVGLPCGVASPPVQPAANRARVTPTSDSTTTSHFIMRS